MPPIRIAVRIDQRHTDEGELRDAALRTEDAGVDIVFTLDDSFRTRATRQRKHVEAPDDAGLAG